jgi:hypothetical protein
LTKKAKNGEKRTKRTFQSTASATADAICGSLLQYFFSLHFFCHAVICHFRSTNE